MPEIWLKEVLEYAKMLVANPKINEMIRDTFKE